MNTNPTQKDIDFFHNKYTKLDDNSCWEWFASKNEKGYGLYKYGGLAIKAHRFAFMLINPTFNQSLHVLHTCDNRACMNPKHLFLGTHQDNMRDRDLKGRQVSGKSFLLEEEIKSILELFASGNFTKKCLGRKFKVSAQYIGYLVKTRGNQNNRQLA